MTSARWEALPEMDQGQDTRPDTIPPVSGRPSRRRTEQISDARKLRDRILKLIEEEPRTEADLIRLTKASKGEVKSALRRLSVADLVFSREGAGWHTVALWHHWPTVIAELRRQEGPARRKFDVTPRATGMRVA